MITNPTFFESLVENSPNLISVINTNGLVVFVNTAYEKILGYKRDELLGKHFSEGISLDPSSKEYTLSIFSAVMAGEMQEEFQVTIFHKQGYPLKFHVKYTLLKEEGYLEVILRNITEEEMLRKAKHELVEENKLLADMLDHSGVGIIITDPHQEDNPIVYHNKGFVGLTGYLSDEIIGRNCRFLQGPLTDTKTIETIRHRITNGKEVKVDILNYRKDGTTFWNELNINPVFNELGEVSHFIGIQKDVTRKKLLEVELFRDFKLSRTIQQLILSNDIDEDLICVRGSYFPSHALGGDFYKWQKIVEDLYFVMIMDVMGHGIASSLLTMSIHAELSSILKSDTCAPSDVLSKLNQHMIDLFSEGSQDRMTRMYFTCIVLLINTKDKRIHYVNAGHPSFIMREQEEVHEIPSNEIPVGFLENHSFQTKTLEYFGGTDIFLFTDGLLEYLNISIHEFKERTANQNPFIDLSKQLTSQKLKDDVCFVQVKLH